MQLHNANKKVTRVLFKKWTCVRKEKKRLTSQLIYLLFNGDVYVIGACIRRIEELGEMSIHEGNGWVLLFVNAIVCHGGPLSSDYMNS